MGKQCPICGKTSSVVELYDSEDGGALWTDDCGGNYGSYLGRLAGGIDVCSGGKNGCRTVLLHKTGKILRKEWKILIPISMFNR